VKQITFQLPEIDREETKKRVEAALEKYRFYLLSVPEERLPRVTASYSLVPPTHTNAFHSSTEESAIAILDFEKEREQYLNSIQRAVNRLNYQERSIIVKRYIDPEEKYDYEVYNDLGMSERKYYRIKSRAFYKLAFALKIESYKTEVSDVTSS
jgi:ArpU family phage transcriptional regulator